MTTIIRNLLDKMEAVQFSTKIENRLDNYLKALAERGNWGKFLGYVKLDETYKVAIFQKILILLDLDGNDDGGHITHYLQKKIDRRPIKGHFTVLNSHEVKYMNLPFVKIDNSTTTGKQLLSDLQELNSTTQVKNSPAALTRIAGEVLDDLRIPGKPVVEAKLKQYNLKPNGVASIQNWGAWIEASAKDAPEEEKNPDFKVLTPGGLNKLDQILETYRKKYPMIDVVSRYRAGNWIDIYVKYK